MSEVIVMNSKSTSDVLAKFKQHCKETGHGKIDQSGEPYLVRTRGQDTVDGNPGVASAQCCPYGFGGGKAMTINGPRGGGCGTFGD